VKVVGVFQSFQFNYDDLDMISVVIPIFNEQENLPALRNRLAAAMETCGEDWEVIFVDDGSRDESSQILLRFHEDDPRLKILTLSRNFGHQPAVTAGIHYAKGDCVVLIDGDLQDPPEVIPEMIRQWQQGFQVVVGERASRSDRGARGLGMRLFYPILRRVTDLPNAANAGIFGLMDRAVIDEFNKLSLRSWLGFKQTTVRYDRGDRAAGKPKQSLPKLVNYAADAMISFSYKPLRAATWLGFLVSVFSFAMGIFYIVTFFEWHKPITGFTTEIVSILFLGGVQLISIGILGEYIGRIYEEVKHRPLYIVRESVGMKNGGG
jgi:glycosyltransferase involved in cell wall biosynthesis